MRYPLWLPAVCGLLGLAAPAVARFPAQDARKGGTEDERIVRLIDHVRTTSEEERDRLAAALRRFTTATVGATANGGDEAEDWFRALAGDKAAWRRDAITQPSLQQLFGYLAERIEVTNDEITRGQFLDFARLSLGEAGVPTWKMIEKPALAEANRAFHEFDRDGDGRLNADEMSGTLRPERQQWDKDRDGFIDRTEYRAFFLNRAQKVLADVTRRAEKGDGRPSLKGGKGAAGGLPAWFAQLDANGDGQIGLYEWRESGWPVADFQRLDRNGDGLLTADEVLWAVNRAKDRGTPDAALTRQLPPDFRKKDKDGGPPPPPPPVTKDGKKGGGG